MADTPKPDGPGSATADSIIEGLKARAARQATHKLLLTERLDLYRDSLEIPLAGPQRDWYAAWRAARAASAADDLELGVDALVRAATAWREVVRVCDRWRAEGEAWAARVNAGRDSPVSYYPAEVPDGPLARWAALLVSRPGLPELAAPLARPECEFSLTVLRIVADGGVTAAHFREFFTHEPFDALRHHALIMAVAMVPHPAGLALDPDECPRPPSAVARAVVCVVAGCYEGAREYLAAAMGFLEAPASGSAPPGPHAGNPYLPDAAAVERLTPEVESLAARYFEGLGPLTAALRAAAAACRAGGGPLTAAIAGLAAAVRTAGLADCVSSLRDAPRWEQLPLDQAAAGFALSRALSCEDRDFPVEVGGVPGGDACAGVLCDIGGMLLDTLRRRTYGPFAARMGELTASCGGPTLAALRERLSEPARLAYRDWSDPFTFHSIDLEGRPEPAGPDGARAVEGEADGGARPEQAPESVTLRQFEQAVRVVESCLRETGPYSRDADGGPGDVFDEQYCRDAFYVQLAEDLRRLRAVAGYEEMRTLVARDFDDELTTTACSRVRRALVRTGMTAAAADGLTVLEVVRHLQPTDMGRGQARAIDPEPSTSGTSSGTGSPSASTGCSPRADSARDQPFAGAELIVASGLEAHPVAPEWEAGEGLEIRQGVSEAGGPQFPSCPPKCDATVVTRDQREQVIDDAIHDLLGDGSEDLRAAKAKSVTLKVLESMTGVKLSSIQRSATYDTFATRYGKRRTSDGPGRAAREVPLTDRIRAVRPSSTAQDPAEAAAEYEEWEARFRAEVPESKLRKHDGLTRDEQREAVISWSADRLIGEFSSDS